VLKLFMLRLKLLRTELKDLEISKKEEDKIIKINKNGR